MEIKEIELFHIKLPLKVNFNTAKNELQERESLIIKVTDKNEVCGFGEVVSFTIPFYTNETLEDSKKVLLENYFPIVLKEKLDHPFDIHKRFNLEFPMALAGFENALLDLYYKSKNKNIVSSIFKEKLNENIDVGIVLGDMDYAKTCFEIEKYKEKGCNRFKIKIKPEDGFIKLKKIREKFPEIKLLADANKSYSIYQIDEIKKIDDLGLVCIEEPFDIDSVENYIGIENKVETPICLDESIQSIEDLEKAIEKKVFKVLNIKIGRLGGLYYVKKSIELCRKNKIKYWIGSMMESGISKILHVQLSALEDVYIPGDLSDSKRYFNEDLIYPDICSKNGKIKVPKGIGLGVEIKEYLLKQVTKEYYRGDLNGFNRST